MFEKACEKLGDQKNNNDTEKEVHELLDEDFYMSDDEKLYYEEKQKFEEKTEGVINRYVAEINDEIHQEYIHAVRQEYSSRQQDKKTFLLNILAVYTRDKGVRECLSLS